MKRYYMRYESDEIICKSNQHTWAGANSIRTAKGYIAKCRKAMAKYNPRNFRVYDSTGESEATCIYYEA